MARKFGLISYVNTGNIGDEVQSIAARGFLPSVDYFVNRELLDEFSAPDGDPVAMILNGWFMHHPHHWPPSKSIWPLLISFHISDWQADRASSAGLRAVDILVAEPVVKYLRGLGPVGARDKHTLALLQAAGVESYFSGCLTLTLERPNVERRSDLIVLCDVPPNVVNHIRKLTDKEVITTTHSRFTDPDPVKRFAEADRLLALYASASCVVTSRLHCALPSLAYGTPVLHLDAGHDPSRFAGLIEFVHNCSRDDFLKGRYVYDVNRPPPNADTFLPYRADLRRRAHEFIAKVQSGAAAPTYPLTPADQYAAMKFLQRQTTKVLVEERKQKKQLQLQLDAEKKLAATAATGASAEDIVRELYQGILEREPEPKWLEFHAQKLRKTGVKGATSEIIQHFLATSEFRKKFAEARAAEAARANSQLVANEVRRKKLTYLGVDKFSSLYSCLDELQKSRVSGDFLEFGVALGGSGICLAKALDGNRRYLGFDVFGMIPPPSEIDGKRVNERYKTIAEKKSSGIGGDPYYGYIDNLHDVVKTNFASFDVPVDDKRILLVKGLFEETVPLHQNITIALAHIDCDWYDPVKYCLNYAWGHLSEGGFIILDDYKDWEGCRLATDEFLASHPTAVVLRKHPHAVIRKPVSQ